MRLLPMPGFATEQHDLKRVPVTRQGTRVSHQHPLDPVFMVWDGDHQTETIEGVFQERVN